MRLPLDDVELTLVTSQAEVDAFRAWEPHGIVACDVETSGLQSYGLHADKLRLVQFGDENRGWALPFSRGAIQGLTQEALDRFSGNLVGHNSRFDEAFLKQAGFNMPAQFDDSYILHHLSFPLDYHGLKSVAGKFYGQGARAGEKWLDQVKRKNRWDWATVPVEHPAYWGYACVPLTTQIFTRSGWRSWDSLTTMDETLAFVDGELKWSLINGVVRKDDEPLVVTGGGPTYELECTPDHRWVVQQDGELARIAPLDTIPARSNQRLVVAAPWLGGSSPATADEAALIAWLLADGNITWQRENSSPNPAVYQAAHNPSVHELRALLIRMNALASENPRKYVVASGEERTCVKFQVRAPVVQRLWDTFNLHDKNFVQFVTDLSPGSRKAFIAAFYAAEGDKGRSSLSQNAGPVCDAVVLALSLDGYKVRLSPKGGGTCLRIGFTRSMPTMQRQRRIGSERRRADVWCPVVEDGSWLARDVAGHIFLTGNCFDTCLTARIWNDMVAAHGEVRGPAAGPHGEPYARELRVARLMAEVAERGMPVDLGYAEGLLSKWADELAEIKVRLDAYQIEKPGSGAQVAAALMNEGWEPDLLTDTGKPSVNRAVLEGMDNEIATLVLRHRRLTKWSASYVKPIIESGGHLHCNISSLRAATGRMAIDSPPLQQLPKGPEVRSCLIADEGTELWAIDFDGQEARELAAYVGDPEFTDEVLNGGDIHGNIAASLHGEDYTSEQRGWSKNAFYAYCYGAASDRLALTAHAKRGEFEKAVAKAYPAIAGFMKGVIATGKRRLDKDGMAWAKTIGGRTVAVPKSRIYALTNYIMQGGGSDLMKLGLERIDDAGLSSTVRLVIHDEVLCAFPQGQGAEMAAAVQACLATEFRGVPFVTHAKGPGRSWGDVA